jgi:hypothetical protein
MDRVELDRLLKARPFEPFTIHTVDGDLVGIKSPEFAWLPPIGNRMVVALDMGDGGATRIISLQHISQVTIGPGVSPQFPSDGGR